jgi:bacteriocin biosynthesis cyclodehydratase domain-containing protein
MMLEYPRLRGFLTIVPRGHTVWTAHGTEGELWRLKFDEKRAAMFSRLLPLMDGTARSQDLARACAVNGDTAEGVLALIENLEISGIIEEATSRSMDKEDQARFADQLLFFSRFEQGRDGTGHQQALLNGALSIYGSGRLAKALASQAVESGIRRVSILADADPAPAVDDAHGPIRLVSMSGSDRGEVLRKMTDQMLLVALEHPDPTLLDDVNEAMLAVKKPWLLVQNRGVAEGIVGPLFVPAETACYACLEARARANTVLFAEYDALKEYLKLQGTANAPRPWGGLAASANLLASFAIIETVKHLTRIAPSRLIGRFCTINWFTLATDLHDVLRLPRCPICRPPRIEVFPWSEIPQPEPEPERAR